LANEPLAFTRAKRHRERRANVINEYHASAIIVVSAIAICLLLLATIFFSFVFLSHAFLVDLEHGIVEGSTSRSRIVLRNRKWKSGKMEKWKNGKLAREIAIGITVNVRVNFFSFPFLSFPSLFLSFGFYYKTR